MPAEGGEYLFTRDEKEQFIKEILTGLVPPPGYFPQNVLLNIKCLSVMSTSST